MPCLIIFPVAKSFHPPVKMNDFLNKEVKKPLFYQTRKFLPIS
jgi:hypothetical protein